MARHEHFTSNFIRFSQEPALLGVDTNGASPQRVYGLFIDGEIYEHKGEVTQNYWLKAALDEKADAENSRQKSEFLMWSENVRELDMVIGSIVSASVLKNWNRTLDSKFESYQNSSQLDFSDDASAECISNLGCRVNSTDTGFAIRFFDKNKTISSLHAKLEDKAITAALNEIKSLRDWSNTHQRTLLMESAAKKEDEPAAPGVR